MAGARTFSVATRANGFAPAVWISRLNARAKKLSTRVALSVAKQVGADLAASVNNLPDELGLCNILLQLTRCSRSSRDESLELEFISIEQEPHHGLLVARVAAEVG